MKDTFLLARPIHREGMVLLTVAKRLEANRISLPPSGAKRRQTLMRRLLFDRDVGPREPWTERGLTD